MKIKNKNTSSKSMIIFLSFMINLFSILIIMILNYGKYDCFQSIYTFITIIQITTSIYFIYKSEGCFISFSLIFYLLSNLFHVGLLPYAFKEGTVYNVNLIDIERLITMELYYQTLIFVFVCHSFLVFGIILNGTLQGKKSKSSSDIVFVDNNDFEKDNKKLKNIGLLLLIIGIVPKFYIDYNKFVLFLNGSYIDTYSFQISGYITFISTLSRYGLMILLLFYRNKKSKKYIILISALLLELLPMLSGHRAQSIIFLITIVFLFLKLDNRIRPKTIILFSLLGYIAIIMLVVIGDLRGNPYKNQEVVVSTVQKYISLKPVNRILQEFGGTIISVAYSLKYFPQYSPVKFGLNYLLPMLYIFPNFGYQDIVYSDIAYVTKFPEQVRQFLGGSYLGEAYYSFNVLGPIVIFLIGFLVSFISFKVNNYIKYKKYNKLVYLLPIMTGLLWYIRDFFGSMVRDVVWFAIIVLFINSILYTNSKTGKGTE